MDKVYFTKRKNPKISLLPTDIFHLTYLHRDVEEKTLWAIINFLVEKVHDERLIPLSLTPVAPREFT